MILCKYTEKFRDKQGKIYGYRLVDNTGQVRDLRPQELKLAIQNKQIQVLNLKLTSDNRLVDANEVKLNTEKMVEKDIVSLVSTNLGVQLYKHEEFGVITYDCIKHVKGLNSPVHIMLGTDNNRYKLSAVLACDDINLHIDNEVDANNPVTDIIAFKSKLKELIEIIIISSKNEDTKEYIDIPNNCYMLKKDILMAPYEDINIHNIHEFIIGKGKIIYLVHVSKRYCYFTNYAEGTNREQYSKELKNKAGIIAIPKYKLHEYMLKIEGKIKRNNKLKKSHYTSIDRLDSQNCELLEKLIDSGYADEAENWAGFDTSTAIEIQDMYTYKVGNNKVYTPSFNEAQGRYDLPDEIWVEATDYCGNTVLDLVEISKDCIKQIPEKKLHKITVTKDNLNSEILGQMIVDAISKIGLDVNSLNSSGDGIDIDLSINTNEFDSNCINKETYSYEYKYNCKDLDTVCVIIKYNKEINNRLTVSIEADCDILEIIDSNLLLCADNEVESIAKAYRDMEDYICRYYIINLAIERTIFRGFPITIQDGSILMHDVELDIKTPREEYREPDYEDTGKYLTEDEWELTRFIFHDWSYNEDINRYKFYNTYHLEKDVGIEIAKNKRI